MKTYEEIVSTYRKRSRDTVVDTVATGVTYVDNIAVEGGILEETGHVTGAVSAVCAAFPFAVIAAVEGTKVLLGRKPVRNGTKDAATRMVKTGLALGAGSVAAGIAGAWAAIPAAIGTRIVLDKKKSRLMSGVRIKNRISRLQELNHQLDSVQEQTPDYPKEEMPAVIYETQGIVE